MLFYRYWLAILPLFFPLYLVRFNCFGIPSNALECLMVLSALLGVLFFLRRSAVKKWLKQQNKSWTQNIFWPIMLFVVAATASMMIVPAVSLDINGDVVETGNIAQGIWKGWIIMPIVYFFMIYTIKRDYVWWNFSMVSLGLSGVALSIWAMYQMVTGDYITLDGRASGPFESANYLALYLGPILIMGIGNTLYLFRGKPNYEAFIWLFMTIFVTIGFLGTQSYAGYLSFFLALIFYAFSYHGLSLHKKSGVAVALVVVFFVMLVSQMNSEKFQQFLEFDERTSSSVRLEVYNIATTLLQEHPVLGLGLGQFELQYQLNAARILGHAPYEWVMLHPHNLLLAIWLNAGALGVVAMVWLLAIVFAGGVEVKKGFFSRWWHRAEHGVAAPHFNYRITGLAMLMMILIHGLFDTPFWKNDLAYEWWWVIALLF